MSAFIGGLSWLTPARSTAQDLEATLYTAGTVTKSPSNQPWAYLSFQIDDPVKLRNRKLAVYVKAGGPASPAPFTRKAVITVQTDALILQALIARAANLGDSAPQLESSLNAIFGELVPDPALSLPKKLSAVIQGALADPGQYGSLVLLSRTHPAVAMALGLAYGEPIAPGESTFEIREFDPQAAADLGVMGRVTVTAGQPVVLPAPAPPVELADLSAKGHLNARLRWGTPLALRRLSLLHFGYNVYRVPRALAESLDFHLAPPDPAVLVGLAADGLHEVRRINRAPALSARVMTEAEAANLAADPKTAFINDDNGLAEDGAKPFADGEQFYYFVTARDLLGRDGLVSPGTLVTLADRVPPSAPRGVVVANDYRYVNGEPIQRLRVSWKQRTLDPDNLIIGYYVHRWKTPSDVAALGGSPLLNRVSPLIPHVDGQAEQSFLDESPGAPIAPDKEDFLDHTIYYTVRAVEGTTAGQNLSGHSAPAGGVLRDREAPAGPGGGVYIECCEPVALPDTTEDLRLAGADKAEAVFDVICTREAAGMAFADIFLYGTAAAQQLARVHFQAGSNTVRKRIVLRRNAVSLPFTIHCRIGSDGGKLSDFAQHQITTLPSRDTRRIVRFRGIPRCTEILWDEAAEAAGCPGHDPHPELQGGEGAGGNAVHGLKVKIDLTDTTKEWRLYRRIDHGKMSLLRQGLADFTQVQQIEVVDKDLPASAVTLFYLGQLLDQNGNASQLALLGKAVPLRQTPPAPMLSPVVLGGTPGNPSAVVKWFCPPQGVERFEVFVHVAPGSIPTNLAAVLGPNHHTPLDQLANGPPEAEQTETLTHGAYYTPQLGDAFGNGPEFQFSFPMAKDQTYLIQVAALSKNGGKKKWGNVQQLKWQGGQSLAGVPVPGTPNVPWPELLPPAPGEAWNPNMVPVQLNPSTFSGVGIRIGELANGQVTSNAGGVTSVMGHGSLNSALYPAAAPSSSGAQMLPLVLYRYQVENARFPQVSHDLIQVTPLMQEIAMVEKLNGGNSEVMELRDPFVRILSQSFPIQKHEIFLLDTQPVVKRAAYAYLMVRFGKDGEISSVHPLPPVTIN
jgi:hypothetical protein